MRAWWACLSCLVACAGPTDDAVLPADSGSPLDHADAGFLGDSGLDAEVRDTAATDAGLSVDAGTLDSGPLDDGGSPRTPRLPPVNAPFDYQLGGPYSPAAGVQIVSRDRTEPIAAGLYNICYVNGLQIQPDEVGFWTSMHPELILRDANGDPVVDTDWNEMLIDVSTGPKRAQVAAIVAEWIRGCAAAGYDAIEIDNLDSYARSGGLLVEDDNVLAMRAFADVAHAEGLAIAQKNSAELVGRRAELSTDFVVAEECNRYAECDIYRGAYGDRVLVIEYRRVDFEAGCAAFPELSIVLRDLNLVTPAMGAYVYDGC